MAEVYLIGPVQEQKKIVFKHCLGHEETNSY